MDTNGYSGVLPDRSPDALAIRLLLSSMAFVWFMIGLGIALGQSASEVNIPGAWHLGVPEFIRVAQWWSAVVLTLAVIASKQPTPRLNAAAVAMLALGPAIRVSSYLGAWALYLIPGGNPGIANGWYWAAIHLGMVVLVVVSALFLRTGDPDQ